MFCTGFWYSAAARARPELHLEHDASPTMRARPCLSRYCRKAPIGGEHALSCLTFQLTRILTLGNRIVPVCLVIVCVYVRACVTSKQLPATALSDFTDSPAHRIPAQHRETPSEDCKALADAQSAQDAQLRLPGTESTKGGTPKPKRTLHSFPPLPHFDLPRITSCPACVLCIPAEHCTACCMAHGTCWLALRPTYKKSPVPVACGMTVARRSAQTKCTFAYSLDAILLMPACLCKELGLTEHQLQWMQRAHR